LKENDIVIVCDAGGGTTVNLATPYVTSGRVLTGKSQDVSILKVAAVQESFTQFHQLNHVSGLHTLGFS
jgi:hypothetical protein